MIEPVLTDEDRRIWRRWERASLGYARTRRFATRLDEAKRQIERMAKRAPDAYLAWSGGKDSTVMTHLIAVECGLTARAMAVKDDLDFPGEEDYVRQLASSWGVELDVVHPPFSLQQWIRDHAETLIADDDMHGRASAFSDAAFYSVVETYRQEAGLPGVYLGLRAEESYGRRMNRRYRGPVYQKKDGEVVCQPVCDWSREDVYAYAFSRGIDLLHVYRCVRFEDHPGDVRKSWWIPGSHGARGSAIWLRIFYPSLWDRLCEILPQARGLA